MSQEDIVDWLKGRGWTASSEILDNISIGRKSMNYSLMALVKHKEIKKKKDKNTKNGYLYKVERC